MIIMAISRCFPTARTIWVKSSPKRHQGVGQEQELPQRVNFLKNFINKGCSGWLWWPFQGFSWQQGPCAGEFQHQKHQGVRQKQDYPKILILRVGLRNYGSPWSFWNFTKHSQSKQCAALWVYINPHMHAMHAEAVAPIISKILEKYLY